MSNGSTSSNKSSSARSGYGGGIESRGGIPIQISAKDVAASTSLLLLLSQAACSATNAESTTPLPTARPLEREMQEQLSQKIPFAVNDIMAFYDTDKNGKVEGKEDPFGGKYGALQDAYEITVFDDFNNPKQNSVAMFDYGNNGHFVGFFSESGSIGKVGTLKAQFVFDGKKVSLQNSVVTPGVADTVFMSLSVDASNSPEVGDLVKKANSGDQSAIDALTLLISNQPGDFNLMLHNMTTDHVSNITIKQTTMGAVPTVSPDSMSPLQSILNFGVTPVAAMGEPTSIPEPSPTAVKTFEEMVATAEYATPALRNDVIGQVAKASGLEAADIQLHVETKVDKNGVPIAFQLDQNGNVLFTLDTNTGTWRKTTYKDLSPKNFQIGASFAIWTGDYDDDPRYKQVFAENFEILATDGSLSYYDLLNKIPSDAKLTPEEAIKLYDWTDFDKIANFAKDNNIPLRAMHAFFSPVDYDTPQWLSNMSNDQLKEYIKLHITAVMSRADFAEASIANEAFNGYVIPNNQFFYSRLGKEYIKIAFETAHEVSPNTILILNDNIVYGPKGEGSPDGTSTNSISNDESNAIFNFVKNEIDSGTPIGGVGIESHLVASDFISGDIDSNIQKYQKDLTALMAKYEGIGVNVYITELDVNIAGLPDDWTQQQKEELKAKIYGAVFRASLESQNCRGVTMWGFSNTASWMLTDGYPYGKGESPLPLDENYRSTATDFEIKKALYEKLTQ